ncbi:hypothetical protein BZL30_5382 [Mycobacterium kansasii]|uniref:Uncharacterized protein n=1 Tax=Mycobacterium kansasii TaxID=1768 RepID=A0A1V3WYY6_MYCKA|nr:hypothetical protein BZL29_8334 [Mycobacterium kansasii]OOK72120.1 hypothetical protein BZL30_5382 [Mycobacterium kansasii]
MHLEDTSRGVDVTRRRGDLRHNASLSREGGPPTAGATMVAVIGKATPAYLGNPRARGG